MKTVSMTVEVTIRSTATVQVEVPDDFGPAHYSDIGDELYAAIAPGMYVEQSRTFTGLGLADGVEGQATLVVCTTPGGSSYLEQKTESLSVEICDSLSLDWHDKFVPCCGHDATGREVVIKPVDLAKATNVAMKVFPFEEASIAQAMTSLAKSYGLEELPVEVKVLAFAEEELKFITERTAELTLSYEVPLNQVAFVSWDKFSTYAFGQFGDDVENLSMNDVGRLVETYIKTSSLMVDVGRMVYSFIKDNTATPAAN